MGSTGYGLLYGCSGKELYVLCMYVYIYIYSMYMHISAQKLTKGDSAFAVSLKFYFLSSNVYYLFHSIFILFYFGAFLILFHLLYFFA